MSQEQTQKQARILPQSEADLLLMTTNPVIGREEINPALIERLRTYWKETDQDGKTAISYEDLWGLLSFYTRDIRLSNLNPFTGEYQYVQYYLDLAGDYLQISFVKCFLICLSRATTILETSQGKGGFTRKRMGTLTTENVSQELDPPKRQLMGGKKNE